MVDMVKKIHKKGADLLNPGEKILGASVINSVGQFKKNVAFGAIGGAVGAAVGAAVKGKGEEAADDTMAEAFPTNGQQILAVSNQRWIVFEQAAMSGGPKSVRTEWPLADITGIELEPGKLTAKVNVLFRDGSQAQVEAVKAAKPDKLAEAAAKVSR